MKLSTVHLLAVLITALLVPPQVAYTKKAVMIVAHRGAPFDAPENTIASAKLAWEQNADAVETDIRLTKDGKIILSHDDNLKRMTGKDALVSSLTLAETRALDAGRFKGNRFAGEKIATLDELIATIPTGKRLFVEIKTGSEILPALEETLASTHATEKNIVLISFNFEVLRQAHQKWPNYTTLWLVAYNPSGSTIEQLIQQSHEAGLNGLDLNADWPLDSAMVSRVKAANLQLHVWTVDDREIAQHWVDIGVDGITTNQAGWVRDQIET